MKYRDKIIKQFGVQFLIPFANTSKADLGEVDPDPNPDPTRNKKKNPTGFFNFF